MKHLISKTWIILALTSPVISLSALSGNFSAVENKVTDATEITNHPEQVNESAIGSIIRVNTASDTVPGSAKAQINNPLYEEKGTSGNNPMFENKAAANRKRVEVLKSNKTADSPSERKGWDGTVKGNSKGINEAGIKRAEAQQPGWDGANSKGITQSGIKRNESQRKGWDGTVKGGNIQEENMNETAIPTEDSPQKTTINTTRSNIKGNNRSSSGNLGENDDISNGTLPAKAEAQDFNTTRSNRERGQLKMDNSGTSNPYYQNNANAGEMSAQMQRGIDKKDIRRGVRGAADDSNTISADNSSQNETLNGTESNQANQARLKTKHDTAKNSVSNIR